MHKEETVSTEDELFLADDDDDENSQENQYLLFPLGEEIYGINIGSITEIVEKQKITEVPDMPEYIKGVINLRGRIIPVLDLRVRFGMETRTYDDRTCIIIVRVGERTVGFIVDTVAEVQNIAQNNIEPPPEFKSDKITKKYIRGLGKVGKSVKILIDVEKVINQEDIEAISSNMRK
jgi:purine-binding chemotaxis protein CheW